MREPCNTTSSIKYPVRYTGEALVVGATQRNVCNWGRSGLEIDGLVRSLMTDFVEKVASLTWLEICQNTNDTFD